MSWADIAKKKIEKVEIKEQTQEPDKPCVTNLDYEETPKELFDLYKGMELFDKIIDIKIDCEKYTPWLFSKAHSHHILDFFYDFINFEESLPKKSKLSKPDDYSSDGSYEQ